MLCIITNSQLGNSLAAKQTLLVADNVINTYNYPNLLTAICKHAPVFVVKVSRPYFFDKAAGRARKIGCLGTRLYNGLQCFDKNASWCTKQTSPVCFAFLVSTTTTTTMALWLNWIHLKIISAATFHITGLTKIAIISSARLDLPL